MKLTFALTVVISLSLVVSAAFLHRKVLSGAFPPTKSDLAAESLAQSSEGAPVRMVRFVLTGEGLYPRQMRVDYSVLNIVVDDKTDRSRGLLIESADDRRARITEINPTQNERRGRRLIKLPPGRYVVSDISQPMHTAELVVNP